MQKIRFSIIIPAYNAAKSIGKTLDSIKAQTYRNFEVIIIDDNSPDVEKLVEVVQHEHYNDLEIQLVLLKKRVNGAGARNKGIELAQGSYISFLDADDEWEADKLSTVVSKIKELNGQQRTQWIIYSQVKIYQDGQFSKVMPGRPVEKNESIASYLFGCDGFIQTSTIVLKRADANMIRFDERFRRHQDYDFCIRADKMGFHFEFIPQPLVIYHLVSHFGSQHKGESAAYSHFWLTTMRPFLSQQDVATYKAYKLPLRYCMDGKFWSASVTFVRYFFLTSKRNQRAFRGRLYCKIQAYISGSKV